MQKSSEFDLRDLLWREILTIWSFKFVFSPEVEKNCWCEMIWCFRLAQSNLKIILSKQQCVLLLHAWWIYVKHSKRAEHAETGKFQRKNKSNNQRPRNLKSKEGDFSNIELARIFCVIYFSFHLDVSKSGEVYPAIHRSGCRVLLKALQ